jgi:hypothetical protein
MKKILVIISLLLLFGSCLKEPDYHSYQVSLVVDFGADFPQDHKDGVKVNLFNQVKNYAYNAETDADGKVLFSSVEPGFYSVTISHSYNSGIITYHYNGLKNIDVFDNKTDSLKLKESIFGDFVIKEVYFSGSTTPAGKVYYADQYLEIFNNTSEIQYADGISVLIHESSNAGTNMWANIKDTIVAEIIWSIPGNGTQVPVAPGKSIIIAQDGINHKDDPNGNPLSPVNLGNADFEFYSYKLNNKDIDAPAVPNLIEDYSSNEIIKEITYDVRGGSAIAIAKIPGNTDEERKAYIKRNLIAKLSSSGSSTAFFARVANKYLIDAVETVKDEAHAIYKRFPPELDAGYTYVTTGSYTGKCVRRKIKESVGGRVIYQDTNNSTEDFLKDVDPKPKIYE